MRDQKQEILNSITEQEAERELSAAEEGMEDRPEAAAADSCCCGERRKLRSEKEAYCIDILNQASAASSALSSFCKVILSSHIRTCVTEDVREGHEEKVDELVKTLQKMMR